jgi:hypothetical protein
LAPCSVSLPGYLSILKHEDLVKSIRLVGVTVLGSVPAGFADQIAALGFAGVTVETAGEERVRHLELVGLHRTPALLIASETGELVFATALPSTARGRLQFNQTLLALSRLVQASGPAH